jgi:biofilm protein TabA
VQGYQTKPRPQGKWEAHRRYIDIQVVLRGAELVGHADLNALTETEPYSKEKDVAFYTGQGNFFVLSAGWATVFLPHDAHMPSLAIDSPAPVQKVVIKLPWR